MPSRLCNKKKKKTKYLHCRTNNRRKLGKKFQRKWDLLLLFIASKSKSPIAARKRANLTTTTNADQQADKQTKSNIADAYVTLKCQPGFGKLRS